MREHMSPLLLLLLAAWAALGSAREQKVPPRRDELFPGEGGSLLPNVQRPLSRNYRQTQQHNIDLVYKLPDEEFDNELGPFESNKLILGDPDAMILHSVGEARGRRVARSVRRPRAVFSTKFEYGRPYRALPLLARAY